jgi:alpha-1,2-glucosyltransferase
LHTAHSSKLLVLAPATLPTSLPSLGCRYFTTPLMMIALHLPMPRLAPLLVILVLYLAVDAGTLYLFLEKPFSWADGSVARFMW